MAATKDLLILLPAIPIILNGVSFQANIRISTITSSADAFFDGAIREACALIARGFKAL